MSVRSSCNAWYCSGLSAHSTGLLCLRHGSLQASTHSFLLNASIWFCCCVDLSLPLPHWPVLLLALHANRNGTQLAHRAGARQDSGEPGRYLMQSLARQYMEDICRAQRASGNLRHSPCQAVLGTDVETQTHKLLSIVHKNTHMENRMEPRGWWGSYE